MESCTETERDKDTRERGIERREKRGETHSEEKQKGQGAAGGDRTQDG